MLSSALSLSCISLIGGIVLIDLANDMQVSKHGVASTEHVAALIRYYEINILRAQFLPIVLNSVIAVLAIATTVQLTTQHNRLLKGLFFLGTLAMGAVFAVIAPIEHEIIHGNKEDLAGKFQTIKKGHLYLLGLVGALVLIQIAILYKNKPIDKKKIV